jgi:hypothetical protein
LYEILVGAEVFRDDQAAFDIIRTQRSGSMPVIGPGVLPSMKTLIKACWKPNPVDRPSFVSILGTFDRLHFDIVSGADRSTVHNYVMGVRDWEVTHSQFHPTLTLVA